MKIFVVYWVDLDNDCLKKSVVKIIGVFSDMKKAKKLRDTYDHEGYSGDSRCYYTRIEELMLDIIPVDTFIDLNEMEHEYEFTDAEDESEDEEEINKQQRKCKNIGCDNNVNMGQCHVRCDSCIETELLLMKDYKC